MTAGLGGLSGQLPVRLAALLDAGRIVLGVYAVAVMLVDDDGGLRLAGATDDVRGLEEVPLAAGERHGVLHRLISPVGVPIGTLSLFRHGGTGWDDDDRRSAAAYAEIVGVMLALTAAERAALRSPDA